ncbi:SDR family oxidoreductase [Rhodopseudomonas palustris]|uniref:NmrA-like n=1 Tax=Rhodopseudomonas palustris (strain BisB18) TaxID=316056 RepID=Q217A7_RHOPB
MRVLIFGATGRTGRHLVDLAESFGWLAHASGRDPLQLPALSAPNGWSVAELADAGDVARVVRAVAPDAVISAIGGMSPVGPLVDEVGNIAISNAAQAAGVRRVIQISSLGCGDSRRYASERIVAAIGPVLDAKTRAEDHLRGLDLDWTIIRPGGLTDAEATATGALYDDPRVHGRIGRAALAQLVLTALSTPATIGRILSAVDRGSLPAEPSDIQEFLLTSAAI